MGLSADAYARQLKALMPPGPAWQGERETAIARLLLAVADELARVDGRAEALVREWDPRTALETLPDWERVLGLPNPCVTEAQTVEARRAAVTAKLTKLGGQSRQFFIELAAALGYAITITEFRPFRAEQSAAGDSLTNGDWVHAWQVNAPETTTDSFLAGRSVAGEPLRSWGNEELECVITARKPAHTHVLFAYDDGYSPALDFSDARNSQYVGGGLL